MNAQQILDEIAYALESRGFVHCTNGKSMGDILDGFESVLKTLKRAHDSFEGCDCCCEPASVDENGTKHPPHECLPCELKRMVDAHI